MFDLTGRVALVTGAGQGVGEGIAACLAARGAVVGVNDLVPERAEAACERIAAAGGEAVPVPFDVTDHDRVVAGFARLAETTGPVTILVNNAGIPPTMALQPFRDTTPADWAPYLAVNLLGVLHCCHAALPAMRTAAWGRIITISSGAGTAGTHLGVATYGAGKGGALSFMRNLALEEARAGITANSVALGLIAKDRAAATAAVDKMAASVPVGRMGLPTDVGALCVYLASDEAGWMTGQTLQLNGGSITT